MAARCCKVRLPPSVPYLLPALRLGAASAVVGTVVAEVSTGLLDGIGRLLVDYAGQASGDPAKAWAPIFGAIAARAGGRRRRRPARAGCSATTDEERRRDAPRLAAAARVT